MNRILFIFSLLCVISIHGVAPAACHENHSKFYCTSEQIEITESAILIYLPESTVEAESLSVDQGGIYYTEDMIRCIQCRRPLNPKNTCEHSNCLAKR